jgi:hypothetical protein
MNNLKDVVFLAIQDDMNNFKHICLNTIMENIVNQKYKDIFLKNKRKYFENQKLSTLIDYNKYLKVELYNINGKEYMIDTENGIVFYGKRADIVEILPKQALDKLNNSTNVTI